jgi:hypothetical protein
MYKHIMIRKQLCITEAQDLTLYRDTSRGNPVRQSVPHPEGRAALLGSADL